MSDIADLAKKKKAAATGTPTPTPTPTPAAGMEQAKGKHVNLTPDDVNQRKNEAKNKDLQGAADRAKFQDVTGLAAAAEKARKAREQAKALAGKE